MRKKSSSFLKDSLFIFAFFLVPFIAQAEEEQIEEEHWSHYESCQAMPGQPFSLNQTSEEETEASFCFLCLKQKQNSLNQLWNSLSKEREFEREFQKKLKDRVIGQIESKLHQIRLIKACTSPSKNKSWLIGLYKKESWSKIQESCEKNIQTIKVEVAKSYPEMRARLALISPRLREDRIFRERVFWMNTTASHLVSGFTKLPKLTKEESLIAEKHYVSALSEVPLDSMSPSEFKSYLESEGYSSKRLSGDETRRLKRAEESLREQSRTQYFEMIGQNFLLAYLKSKSPNNEELAQAYSEMEQSLSEFLEEEIKASKNNLNLLISYEPLVQELLEDDKGEGYSSKYCLIAETTRLKAPLQKKRRENINLALSLASILPCFFGGGVALTVCLGGAGALSVVDLSFAQKEATISLHKRLTGKDFETIANLKKTQRELHLTKVFFSLNLLEAGTVAKGVGLARDKIKKLQQ